MTRRDRSRTVPPATAGSPVTPRHVPGERIWLWSGIVLFGLSMVAGLVRSLMTGQIVPRVGVEYTTEFNELADTGGKSALLPHLRAAARIDFDNHLVISRLVDEARAAGDLSETVWALTALTRLQPEDGRVRTELVVALLEQARFTAAYEQGRFAVWLSPNDPRAHSVFGSALLGIGQPQQAAAAFQRALELDPNSAQARQGLSAAMQGLK